MSKKHLFFDLDGTLTDSSEGITKSVAYALKNVCGIEVTDLDSLRVYIGPPLVDGFHDNHGVDIETAKECTKSYRERYSVVGKFENRLYDGIAEVLAQLQQQGYGIHLATSKPLIFSAEILDHFDLTKYFDEVCGATIDGRISSKEDVIRSLLAELPDAKPEDLLMIGDRKFDVEGAHECGIPCMGVLYGFGDRAEMIAAGADDICPIVADLPAHIEQFFKNR